MSAHSNHTIRPDRPVATERTSGFTLLEIMVALAVIAIGATATLILDTRLSGNAAHLQQRVSATWLARNLLEEYRLNGSWPERQNAVLFAGQQWHWSGQTSANEADDSLSLLTVTVSTAGATPLTVTGYGPLSGH